MLPGWDSGSAGSAVGVLGRPSLPSPIVSLIQEEPVLPPKSWWDSDGPKALKVVCWGLVTCHLSDYAEKEEKPTVLLSKGRGLSQQTPIRWHSTSGETKQPSRKAASSPQLKFTL